MNPKFNEHSALGIKQIHRASGDYVSHLWTSKRPCGGSCSECARRAFGFCKTHEDAKAIECTLDAHDIADPAPGRSALATIGRGIAHACSVGDIVATETESDEVPWILVRVEVRCRDEGTTA